MDLYMTPFSCSFAVHVACLEAGLPHTLRYVDRRTKRLEDGRDYRAVAPFGLVPALGLDDGTLLTETCAVLQYVADAAPGSQLAAPWGTPERYRLLQWLAFLSTEIHKRHLGVLFGSKTPEPMRAWARASLPAVLAHVARALGDAHYLLEGRFGVADAYLYWCLFAAPHAGVSLDSWPTLLAYEERHRGRESIRRAFAIEGPLYERERAAELPAPPA